MILKGNNIDTSRTTQLAMGVTDNAIKAFTTRKIAATLLAPPYAEELEAKGYNKLAEARAYAPLSFIGLVSSTETVKKNPLKVQAMIAGLYRTMIYIHNPANRKEVIQYIARYHVSIWHSQKKPSLRRCNRTAKTAPNRGRLWSVKSRSTATRSKSPSRSRRTIWKI
jgi:ABC-type nitrate/sulfonate/bicarbonate transport system substrate-binding protein